MDIIIPNDIIKGTISGIKKDNTKYIKAKLQKIELKANYLIQLSLYTQKQVFHQNYNNDEIKDIIINQLETNFNNLELITSDYTYSYRITSKGKVLSNKKKNKEEFVITTHNKKKNYLIEEGMIVPALVDLGIMTSEGKIIKSSYDKYRQINRFLEIINDSISDEKELNIVDFGCGKSYLTFILYYYLVEIKKMNINIVGLDLKDDVIDNCNNIAIKYGYKNLKFYKGDIKDYKSNNFNMIVTLHACDTATDYALYHAINMKCKYIFSVPCCQHEINAQIKSEDYSILTRYGIVKERVSALMTDAIRANVLEYCGYNTQLLEFIDIAHSPKNILIRAVSKNRGKRIEYAGRSVSEVNDNKSDREMMCWEEAERLCEEFHIKQTLMELVRK